ncbi:MAG: hypothetical protein ABWY36_04130 [Leifsonia sp.]
MRTRWIVLIAAAVAVVFAGGGIALATLQPTAAGGSSTAGPRDAADPGSDADDGGSDGGDSTSGPDGSGDSPDAAAPGVRLDEWGSGETAAPTLPPPTTRPYILSGAIPAAASASGKLAKGFPDTIPAAPDSDIDHSSLTSEGTRLQVALTATTTLSLDDVLNFYRVEFARYGLLDSPAPATGGQTAVAFARDDDSITLAITPADDGVTYALFGALTAHD